jgi:hypothetical protein
MSHHPELKFLLFLILEYSELLLPNGQHANAEILALNYEGAMALTELSQQSSNVLFGQSGGNEGSRWKILAQEERGHRCASKFFPLSQVNSMPPRTTEKSHRPRASDRTMVDTRSAQPIWLAQRFRDRPGVDAFCFPSYAMIPERSSPSRVRFAAPKRHALDRSGPF